MLWIDVTIPMTEEMTVWPGDPAFSLEPDRRMANGDSCNVSMLRCSTHTGTHVDAPWHFEDDGPRLEAVPTEVFFGQATVLDVRHVEKEIAAADLGPAPLPPRVLLKTRMSALPVDAPFTEDYVALSPEAAQRMVDDGVRVVGIDYLSVAPFRQPGQPTHHILLRAGVFIVEGLRLEPIAAGACEFVVLPLSLKGADGSPCRAFVGVSQ